MMRTYLHHGGDEIITDTAPLLSHSKEFAKDLYLYMYYMSTKGTIFIR